jgi:hypothetical protein
MLRAVCSGAGHVGVVAFIIGYVVAERNVIIGDVAVAGKSAAVRSEQHAPEKERPPDAFARGSLRSNLP